MSNAQPITAGGSRDTGSPKFVISYPLNYEPMETIINEILLNSTEFLYGPAGSINYTLDATRILNDFLLRHSIHIDERTWDKLHGELFDELRKFQAGSDRRAVAGSEIPVKITPVRPMDEEFHALPYYDDLVSGAWYYKRKADRTVKQIDLLSWFIGIVLAFCAAAWLLLKIFPV